MNSLPTLWCAGYTLTTGVRARHELRWCATFDNNKFPEDTHSVPTFCGHYVVLPAGMSKTKPTCPDCIEKLLGEVGRTRELAEEIRAITGKSDTKEDVMVDVGGGHSTDKSVEEVEVRFQRHSMDKQQTAQSNHLREEAKKLALDVDRLVPNSREKSLALTHLEESLFWMNAAIARRTE